MPQKPELSAGHGPLADFTFIFTCCIVNKCINERGRVLWQSCTSTSTANRFSTVQYRCIFVRLLGRYSLQLDNRVLCYRYSNSQGEYHHRSTTKWEIISFSFSKGFLVTFIGSWRDCSFSCRREEIVIKVTKDWQWKHFADSYGVSLIILLNIIDNLYTR